MELAFAGLHQLCAPVRPLAGLIPDDDVTSGHSGARIPAELLVPVRVRDLVDRRRFLLVTQTRHKPAPEACHSVAAALKVDPGDICLIASHVWDTIGAGAAGWQTALILREGNAPLDVGPQPDYIGKDLDAIADQLIARYATAANASRPGH